MRKQAMFDAAFRGVIAQGKPSMLPGSTTMAAYHGADNCKCNFGHVIPDDLFDPSWETKRACLLLESYPKLAEFLEYGAEPDGKFAFAFQAAHDLPASKSLHDGMDFIAEYVIAMRKLADKFCLNTDVIDELVVG